MGHYTLNECRFFQLTMSLPICSLRSWLLRATATSRKISRDRAPGFKCSDRNPSLLINYVLRLE